MVTVQQNSNNYIHLPFSGLSMMKQININTLTQCLKELHRFEETEQLNKNEHLNLLKSTLELVNCLRLDHWNLMPYSVKEQISVEPSDPGSYEVIYLLGRCFNLSMNSKILQQCEYTDPMMAEKLLKDFHILETVLKCKLNTYGDLSETMDKLNI